MQRLCLMVFLATSIIFIGFAKFLYAKERTCLDVFLQTWKGWEVFTETDTMTDEVSHCIHTLGVDPNSCNKKAIIVITAEPKSPEVVKLTFVFATMRGVPLPDKSPIYRIDKDFAIELKLFGIKKFHDGLIWEVNYPSGRYWNDEVLINSMKKGNQMRIRYYTFKSIEEVVFSLKGFTNVFQELINK